MVRKTFIFAFFSIFLISVSGCATGGKQKELEIQGLRNQISVLEVQIQSKDEEINALKDSLVKAQEVREVSEKQASKKKVIGEVKSRPKVKQIQIALKNGGYNPGAIDGRLGKQTRQALKAFQKAHNLSADGKVGRQTWNLLREYLYKKVK